MARKVLLFTTVDWMSTARYAGGFAAASWSVEAISPANAPVVVSRYIDASHAYRPLLALSSLRVAIGKARPDLIVACDDRAVSLLLRLYKKTAKAQGERSWIAALIRRSLGTPENFASMISRSESMTITREIGIRTPRTIAVANEAELDTCLEELGFPAVLKIDGSWGGDGVVVARSKEEAFTAFRRLIHPASRLRSLARAILRRDPHFLLAALSPPRQRVSVQKFVAGRPSASAFACWEGEIVGGLYYDVLVADGAIGPPNVIRRVDCAQMEEASRRVAKQFGLSGIYGLDFIRDEAGDVHLIEINPRTTQGGTLPFGEGRDLPSALAGCITHCAATRRETIANDTVVFFPSEWQRNPASPYLSLGHHNVPWDDPAVLKHCFDAMPEAQSSEKKAAIKSLLSTAGVRREAEPLNSLWRRAFAGN